MIALGTLTMLYVVRRIIDLAINSPIHIIYHNVPMKNVVEIGVLALVKELLVTLDLTELGWQVLLGMAAL